MRVPVILCVDVEPDPRRLDPERPEPWRGYEASIEALEGWRLRLADATGAPVHYSWFLRMDPQIEVAYGSPAWAAEKYPEVAAEFRALGDEIGLHVHACRWDEAERTWVVDHGDARWVDHCLDVGFEAFKGSVGFACRSFRFGDRFMSPEALAWLERHDCRFELTPEPGSLPTLSLEPSERSTGSIPDWRRVDGAPSRRESGLTVIPLTTGWLPRSWFPDSRLARWKRRVRRYLDPGFDDWHPHATLDLARPARHCRFLVEQALAALDRPFLAAVVRTSTAAHPARRAEMDATLAALATHPRARDFVFTTPGEAMELLS